MTPTIPAPTTESERTGDYIPGTIGFDLYVALLGRTAPLTPPRLPTRTESTHA